MFCISCHFKPLKPLTLRMDHAKLLDVLTSLPVSHAVLLRAVCFAMSRPAYHAICSFIDSSGYASRPSRICLFIDYIITEVVHFRENEKMLNIWPQNEYCSLTLISIFITLERKRRKFLYSLHWRATLERERNMYK